MAIQDKPSVSPQMLQPTSHLTIDPNIRGGVPCVGNPPLPVAHILECLAVGQTQHQLVNDHPGLTLADIHLALEAAAALLRDPSMDWSALTLPEMVELQRELREWQALGDEALHSESEPFTD